MPGINRLQLSLLLLEVQLLDHHRLARSSRESGDKYYCIPNQRLGLICRFSNQWQLNAMRADQVPIVVRFRDSQVVCIHVDAKCA